MNPIKKLTGYKGVLLVMLFAWLSNTAMAAPKAPNAMLNPLAQVLVFIMILLALAIGILAHVVNGAVGLRRDELKKQRQQEGAPAKVLSILAITMLSSITALAQEAGAPVASDIYGLSLTAFYVMIGVIVLELILIIALLLQLRSLLGIDAKAKPAVVRTLKPKESWWWRINKAVAVENEKDIDLSHDYDGIRELDNRLPPWWIAAFALTILFSAVYLWRYHVSHSAPLMIEELEISLKKAAEEKAAYLAKSANNVDESTVAMLDAGGIAQGRQLFVQNCVACHGSDGQGASVGPNLSDEYWLHGGSINDVFKTIKYGVVEKGMRSWKDDLSPMQMAQLASYIKSIQGQKFPNAREPQGNKYEEAAASGADSTTVEKPTNNTEQGI